MPLVATSLMVRKGWQMTGLMLIVLTGAACVHDRRHRFHHGDYYPYYHAEANPFGRYHYGQPQPTVPRVAPVIVIPSPAPPLPRHDRFTTDADTKRFTPPSGAAQHRHVHKPERHEHRVGHRDHKKRN